MTKSNKSFYVIGRIVKNGVYRKVSVHVTIPALKRAYEAISHEEGITFFIFNNPPGDTFKAMEERQGRYDDRVIVWTVLYGSMRDCHELEERIKDRMN